VSLKSLSTTLKERGGVNFCNYLGKKKEITIPRSIGKEKGKGISCRERRWRAGEEETRMYAHCTSRTARKKGGENTDQLVKVPNLRSEQEGRPSGVPKEQASPEKKKRK